jgi:hypothetical protein
MALHGTIRWAKLLALQGNKPKQDAWVVCALGAPLLFLLAPLRTTHTDDIVRTVPQHPPASACPGPGSSERGAVLVFVVYVLGLGLSNVIPMAIFGCAPFLPRSIGSGLIPSRSTWNRHAILIARGILRLR